MKSPAKFKMSARRMRGPRGLRGRGEGLLRAPALSTLAVAQPGRWAAAWSCAHRKCKTGPHAPGRQKGRGRGEGRPPPAATPAVPSRSFQNVGSLYGVGHTRSTGHQPQQKLPGRIGQGPGRCSRKHSWRGRHSAPDGPEGWARWAFPLRPRVSQGAQVRERGCRVGALLVDRSLWPRRGTGFHAVGMRR